jgi:hypothetical protein
MLAGGDIALLTGSYADSAGKRVGSDTETCFVYRAKPLTLQCTIAARLPGGQIAAVGVAQVQHLPFSLAVVGGTGSYDGARGTLTVSGGPKGTQRATFALQP